MLLNATYISLNQFLMNCILTFESALNFILFYITRIDFKHYFDLSIHIKSVNAVMVYMINVLLRTWLSHGLQKESSWQVPRGQRVMETKQKVALGPVSKATAFHTNDFGNRNPLKVFHSGMVTLASAPSKNW